MRALMLLLLAAALAGCMDGDDGDNGDDNGANGDDGGDNGGNGGETHDVTIQDFEFSPETLSIAVGDTVRWTNQDSTAHNAVGDDFSTGTLQQGESGEVTFTEAGSFDYVCTFHPGMMTGTITVD